MITGKIRLYDEPIRSYQSTTNYRRSQGYDEMYGGMYQVQTPLFKDQGPILEEAIKTGASMGFILGARVKRRTGTGSTGTIVYVHQSFTQAWNYSTGELEPFKVTWDGVHGGQNGTFDYSIADLELVADSNTPAIFKALQQQLKEEHDETLLNLC